MTKTFKNRFSIYDHCGYIGGTLQTEIQKNKEKVEPLYPIGVEFLPEPAPKSKSGHAVEPMYPSGVIINGKI